MDITIFIIDKSSELIEHTIKRFKNVSYKFIFGEKEKEIIQEIKKQKPTIILSETDLNLIDGIELCSELKSNPLTQNIPFIFLSEKADDYIQIDGYNAGCDDFIPKAYKSRLLVAKINAFVRRLSAMNQEEKIHIKRFGQLEIDEQQYLVSKKGEVLKFSKKEIELIFLLTSTPNKVFKRTYILSKIWGDDIIVGDRNIDTHIKKIRKKIGKSHIDTVRGIGYKFIP